MKELGYHTARIFFEPRDIWVGVYWKRTPYVLEIYVCIVPMLPIHFMWVWIDAIRADDY